MINVLYVAPLIPAPSGSGGKKAIFNHVEEIKVSPCLSVTYVFVDVEEEGQDSVKEMVLGDCHVFNRGLPQVTKGFFGKFRALIQLFFEQSPRSAAVVTSNAARRFIEDRVKLGGTDVIVVDHLNAFGLVKGLEQSVPILYVAHNIESKIIAQQIREGGLGLASRKLLELDLAKLKQFETDLLARADQILLIGAADANNPEMSQVSAKTIVWSELPALKSQAWVYQKTRRLLFVGSARYFPNRDAIDWLVHELMPHVLRIDPGIVLHLVGTAALYDGKTQNQKNVVFEGFVSTDRLENIHKSVDMFVCPVILGAGIKIKVLEAASWGVPVAATVESLEGIDFLDNAALQIDRNPVEAAQKLISRLNDSEGLSRMSLQSLVGLAQALAKRARLDEIIQGCKRECH